jgi:hypothetical protein
MEASTKYAHLSSCLLNDWVLCFFDFHRHEIECAPHERLQRVYEPHTALVVLELDCEDERHSVGGVGASALQAEWRGYVEYEMRQLLCQQRNATVRQICAC